MENNKKGSRFCLLGLIPTLLLVALLLLTGCAAGGLAAEPGEGSAEPYLVEEESFFSDYAVVDDHVYFLCRLTVRNPSETPLPVEIRGDFSADAESGLIMGLFALRLDGGTGADFLALDATEQEAILGDQCCSCCSWEITPSGWFFLACTGRLRSSRIGFCPKSTSLRWQM